jgi:choline dehydrogenase-like flavoprotein
MGYVSRSTSNNDLAAASATTYDVVIVGSGVSGAIIAKELSEGGFSVLILEAGAGHDMTIPGYESYLATFYSALSKDNNAPYPVNRNAPMPRSPETRALRPGQPDGGSGYFVQNGPLPLESTYARVLGGTTMHWQATALRMLPEDFEMQTKFGRGVDWPITYDQLEPFYRKAECELGVSGDVEDQAYLGVKFPPNYVYPMRGIPMSYLDNCVKRGLGDAEVEVDGQAYGLNVRPIPQARNAIPNSAYDGGKGYVPTGAVSTHQTELGMRCQGNNNCVPICPVQAKYDARKTLFKALNSGKGRVDLFKQTVASKVVIDPISGRVAKIEYKQYHDLQSSEHVTGSVTARIFVIAANAVETPRLMLASGLPSSSDMMGRNLMDHPYLLAWGLMPEIAGTMRGTQSTGGIEDLRGGSFRRNQAAFRIDIHNDGWGWATGSPYSDLLDLVDGQNKFAGALRKGLVDRVSRQLLLAFMMELLPERSNRVTVDMGWTDPLGNPRPVISYDIPEYSRAGIAYARQLSRRIFQRIGVEDHTAYDPEDYGYLTYEGQGYAFRGGNHFAGTHVMGPNAKNSVVDDCQRSWDHENLYLAGAGSMCSIGTANTTLTLAALCFKTAGRIIEQLRRDPFVVAIPQPAAAVVGA